MWVRTQDKEKLVKAHLIELLSYEDNKGNLKHEIISVVENAYERTLGKYSTKEKALKVLDMIQEHIKGKSNTYFTINAKGGVVKNHEYFQYTENNVFQMPQDEEVTA